MIQLKTPEEMETIARGGAIIAGLFEQLAARIEPGISTGDIDALVETFIGAHDGARSGFLRPLRVPGPGVYLGER